MHSVRASRGACSAARRNCSRSATVRYLRLPSWSNSCMPLEATAGGARWIGLRVSLIRSSCRGSPADVGPGDGGRGHQTPARHRHAARRPAGQSSRSAPTVAPRRCRQTGRAAATDGRSASSWWMGPRAPAPPFRETAIAGKAAGQGPSGRVCA